MKNSINDKLLLLNDPEDDEQAKKAIKELLADAEIGIINMTALKLLVKLFDGQAEERAFKDSLFMDCAKWANSENKLNSFIWHIFCKNILHLKGEYDDYTYNVE